MTREKFEELLRAASKDPAFRRFAREKSLEIARRENLPRVVELLEREQRVEDAVNRIDIDGSG